VLLGGSTHRLVRDQVTTEQVESLTMKGKAEPVAAWRLLDAARSPRAAKRRATNLFVGRDPQLRLLQDAFQRAVGEHTCQLVTVLGTAGIGKTRLAEEFAATISDALVLTGRCLSYGQGATYWPLRQAVLGAVGLTGEEPADAAEAAFTAVLRNDPDAANIVNRLLILAGFNREAVPEDVPWAVRLFLELLAAQWPVLLEVDDLHWAESGLLEVLEHVADWSRDSPIMLLGLARPEFYDSRPAWGGGKLNATAVLLSPLDDAATVSLVDKHDLPEAIKRRIVDTSGGNPLFAEQLVAMLADEGPRRPRQRRRYLDRRPGRGCQMGDAAYGIRAARRAHRVRHGHHHRLPLTLRRSLTRTQCRSHEPEPNGRRTDGSGSSMDLR